MTATNALTLPQGTTPQLVLETLNQRLPVAIVNHSMRTVLLARAAAAHPLVGLGGSWDDEVVFYACALHDRPREPCSRLYVSVLRVCSKLCIQTRTSRCG